MLLYAVKVYSNMLSDACLMTLKLSHAFRRDSAVGWRWNPQNPLKTLNDTLKHRSFRQ